MTADEAKKMLDAMGGGKGMQDITKGLEESLKRIPETILPFMQEFQRLHSPKSKKDVVINGKNMAVSMLDDGRVIVTCPTLDDAEYVYGNVGKLDLHTIENTIKRMSTETTEWRNKYEVEKNKPWYKKLFGR